MNEFATYHALVIVFTEKHAEVFFLWHFRIIVVEVYKIAESLGSLSTQVGVYSKTLKIRSPLFEMNIGVNSEVTLSSGNLDENWKSGLWIIMWF